MCQFNMVYDCDDRIRDYIGSKSYIVRNVYKEDRPHLPILQ